VREIAPEAMDLLLQSMASCGHQILVSSAPITRFGERAYPAHVC
jgi:hypothetical protein